MLVKPRAEGKNTCHEWDVFISRSIAQIITIVRDRRGVDVYVHQMFNSLTEWRQAERARFKDFSFLLQNFAVTIRNGRENISSGDFRWQSSWNS